MNAAEKIIQTLLKLKANTAFGLPGGTVIPLFDAILENENKFNCILVRHEQCAAHAADAYARVLGKPGIAIATSGPGATNLVTGIANAYMDSSPLIAFGGQVSTEMIGKDAFQEADMLGITLPIVKHSFQLRDPAKIESTIADAFKIATKGRPGPVYIDVPRDVQAKQLSGVKSKISFEPANSNGKPNIKQVVRAAKEIVDAERPVILAGGGCIWSNCSKELYQLAEFLKAPVATTLMGKGAFPEQHVLSLGMTGMHGKKAANYAILNSDVLIAIGTRFSDRITGKLSEYARGKKVIHIDIDTAEIDKNVISDIPIVGDAKQVISALVYEIKKYGKKKETEWHKKIKEYKRSCDCCDINVASKTIDPRRLIFELKRVIKDKDIITTGVGQHQMFAAHHFKRKYPRTFISSGGLGTMGFGVPAALGAKIARPDRDVWNIDGDGSFAMTCHDLATFSQNNLKAVHVIFNNSYLGMVRQWLEMFYERRYSKVLLGSKTDFAKLAEAYSLNGIEVTRPGSIASALREAMRSKKATVIDVKIKKEANILPMMPPGGTLKDYFGTCIKKGDLYLEAKK